MRSRSPLTVCASRRVSPPPPGTARNDRSPDSIAAATREIAITGRAIHHVDSARIATSKSNVPTSNQIPSCAKLKRAARTKRGTAMTSELKISLKKKLSQGRWWSRRPVESVWKSESVGLSTRRLAATSRSRPFLRGLTTSTFCLLCLALRTALIGPGNFGGQGALSRGGHCDLLSSGGDGPAAQGDSFDGRHRLFDVGALLLGGELDRATRLGHRRHDLQPVSYLTSPQLDRCHRRPALDLGGFDERDDLSGGGFCTLGQPSDFVRDHTKAASRLTRSGGFDGRVAGEEDGLVRNIVDELEDGRG